MINGFQSEFPSLKFTVKQSNMENDMESLKPIEGAGRSLRKRFTLADELKLALLPTAIVLLVFIFVEVLSHQRLLFASLASSAFLIYLDPEHGTNRIRTLVLSQMLAAGLGLIIYTFMGPHYYAAAIGMVSTIFLMIVFDAMHPPAVATALSFSFRAGDESNLVLFGLSVLITAVLVLLARAMVWLIGRKIKMR